MGRRRQLCGCWRPQVAKLFARAKLLIDRGTCMSAHLNFQKKPKNIGKNCLNLEIEILYLTKLYRRLECDAFDLISNEKNLGLVA
jgi:hypothetical protein